MLVKIIINTCKTYYMMVWKQSYILSVLLLWVSLGTTKVEASSSFGALNFANAQVDRIQQHVSSKGNIRGGDECETCKQVVADVENHLNDPELQDSVVDFVLMNVCPLFPGDTARTCAQEARVVVAQIAASIQQSFDPERVCTSMGVCGVTGNRKMKEMQMDRNANEDVVGKPWFCHGLDCPYFDILESNEDFETRRYKHGVWASTVVETYLYAVASPMGFRRLFNYIDEGNALGVKIPMTSPVRIQVEPSCGVFCKQNFTVSFYMPKAWQDNPPAPLDPQIFIEKTKAMTVYVKAFGGYKVDDMSVANMAKSLAEDLDKHGKAYDGDSFVMAGYDPPFRFKHRHNEIWMTASDASSTRAGDVPVVEEIIEQVKRLAAFPLFQESPGSCDTCIDVIQEIATIIQDPENQREVIEYMKEGCSAAPSLQETCEEFVDDFGSFLIISIAAALVPDDICTSMGYCNHEAAQSVRPF